MKQHYAHLALIGAAAIIVLYLLTRKTTGVAASPVAVPVGNPGNASDYPNTQPIGKVEIGGSPISITYNVPHEGSQPNDVFIKPGATGSGGCCDECGAPAGVFVTTQMLPQNVYDNGLSNLNSYHAKYMLPSRSA